MKLEIDMRKTYRLWANSEWRFEVPDKLIQTFMLPPHESAEGTFRPGDSFRLEGYDYYVSARDVAFEDPLGPTPKVTYIYHIMRGSPPMHIWERIAEVETT